MTPVAASTSHTPAGDLETRVLAFETGLQDTQDATRRLEAATPHSQTYITTKLSLLLQHHGLEGAPDKRRHLGEAAGSTPL